MGALILSFFLKAVSGTYLFFVWLTAVVVITHPSPIDATVGGHAAANLLTVLIAISLSIPAAIMFGFAQIVADIRIIRNHAQMQSDHLTAMRRYYEPERQRREVNFKL
jgi:hypothetical protein